MLRQSLVPGVNVDSLNTEARRTAADNILLNDILSYNNIRNDILSSDLASAGDKLTGLLVPAPTDSMAYRWAKYYNLMASVKAYENLHQEAVYYFRKALIIYDKYNDRQQAAAVRFNLSNIFLSRRDYSSAHQYSRQAHDVLTSIGDTLYLPMTKALVAISSLHTGNLTDSIGVFAAEALELSTKYNNIQGLMMSYYALGEYELKNEQFTKSLDYLTKAVSLGEKFNQKQIMLSGGAAILASHLGLNEYDKAVVHGEKTIALAKETGNQDILHSLYKNVSKGYAGKNNHRNAFLNMELAEQMYREKSDRENQEVIQDMLQKYESEKKNNLILVQENKIQKRTGLIMLLGFISIISLGWMLYHRKMAISKRRALREQKEKEVLQALTDGEEKERTRLAGELHDGIASQLVAIRYALENKERVDTDDRVVQLLREAHKDVRLIAHNLTPLDFDNIPLPEAIRDYCHRTGTESLPIEFYTNEPALKPGKNISHGLYRAVQELVQNAIKHARATAIHIQCVSDHEQVLISVEDDGIGISGEEMRKGTGNQFLKKRLETFGARLEIDSVPERGTSAHIVFPLKEAV